MSPPPGAVIVGAVRTPMGRGKPGGALSGVHPTDLLAGTLEALVKRAGVDPGQVDDVIAGCVSQAGEQSINIARNAVLAAGFPEHVPGTTVDRQCGSSQQAVHFAAQGVMAGAYDLVIACGVESMSRVPMLSSTMGANPFGERLAGRYPGGLVHQGISAELIAARWGLARGEIDALAASSHHRAAAARDAGDFAREIEPVQVPGAGGGDQGGGEQGGGVLVDTDEGIRAGTTVERLAELPAAFEDAALARRFPEIAWVVTAGNSSQLTDGAAALLIASPQRARELGLRPRARLHAFAVTGDDPLLMLTGVIPATRRVLARAGLALSDIDLFEVNEAFATVVLAWLRETGADPARVNVRGGAVALGHPLGATGARLMTTLLHALEDRGGRYGLQTMCEGGGMANATVIERLDELRPPARARR